MLDTQSLSSLPMYLTYDDVLLLPQFSDVRPNQTDVSTHMGTLKLEMPIISSPMDTVTESLMAERMAELGGLGVIHRNLAIATQADMVAAVVKKQLPVIAAVGAGDDLEARVEALLDAGVTGFCVDSAHGYSAHIMEATKLVRSKAPGSILISGNVATYEAADALFGLGANALRVGMGPGSICTTRVMSGMGVPQLTAVVEAVRAAKKHGGHVIADGGIKTSGDIVKALAAGADSVMLGSLLAGTDEAPGDVIELHGQLFKSYRGMGSVGAMKDGSAARYGQEYKPGKAKRLVPEGVEGLVKHTGSLEEHLHQLVGGLRSGMSYLGAKDLETLRHNATFIRISPAALTESRPHSILEK